MVSPTVATSYKNTYPHKIRIKNHFTQLNHQFLSSLHLFSPILFLHYFFSLSCNRIRCDLIFICISVIEAANGLQAWKILEDLTIHIDLVLTEVAMPGLSGIGLLYKIMSHKARKNIPVISKFFQVPIYVWFIAFVFLITCCKRATLFCGF